MANPVILLQTVHVTLTSLSCSSPMFEITTVGVEPMSIESTSVMKFSSQSSGMSPTIV